MGVAKFMPCLPLALRRHAARAASMRDADQLYRRKANKCRNAHPSSLSITPVSSSSLYFLDDIQALPFVLRTHTQTLALGYCAPTTIWQIL
ncbi:hypothetical protein CBOM_07843 [Ceraceosorus bombacis]|uniref:Uncharacterized protein n=1 Tax=Ceraceosorus bombacis TaxID=401625 RepID=A0A0P1BQJ1_9BASI|nr:hypothetical protein CBOM_07843 [Ceraceosorus bombacis]